MKTARGILQKTELNQILKKLVVGPEEVCEASLFNSLRGNYPSTAPLIPLVILKRSPRT